MIGAGLARSSIAATRAGDRGIHRNAQVRRFLDSFKLLHDKT